ncbi:acetylajmalan esterase-like [Salvia miltiorrhiza]|uniref:acetylajmalan esterase-like n=1 Tax=Salvia miltiorrhiza TaxID=226208 RepID=UPI0025AD6571|nr:acetylajmalan esterase-like [Salvia miltiorrhiza]
MNRVMDFSLLFCVISSISITIIATTEATRILCPIESLFQFGDSISDTGNVARLLPVGPTLPASKPPYGETFPGRPTGRWSDGRLIIDYTAMTLGLPLLNPYLDKNASFRNGVNFAAAGATALNSSFFVSRGILVPNVDSLDLQLRSFRTYLASICSVPRECGDYLRRALILVGEIGGNDINYPLAQGKSLEEIRTYVPFINQAISNATREIIRAGASRVVVPGNFPIGCFPFALAAFASNDSTTYDELGCVRSANNLVVYQNKNLQAVLDTLRREFPSVVIIYADYYNAFLKTFRLAPFFGFDRTTLLKPCCRSRQFNPFSPQFCGNPNVSVCPNPQQYIHWDGLHLTQKAYHCISQIVIPYILSTILC